MGENQKSKELKPCPFCGSKVEIERIGTHKVSTIIRCENCGCNLETGETGDSIGNAWNDRAHEDHRSYGELGEANEQVRLNIEEKNRVIKGTIAIKQDRDNLTELSKWLMGYVIELHEFRSRLATKEHLSGMTSELKNEILMKFPMLQGSLVHSVFRKLGISDFSQEKVKNAINFIKNIEEPQAYE